MLQEQAPKIILVMGITGAGKSYLISKITGQNVKIGHGLESCTSEVGVINAQRNGHNIMLLDTPGFDDTNKTDTDILELVTTYLYTIYKSNVKVTGIIYVQRISDIRMQGSSAKNLKMFQELCGDKTFGNVVFLTTRWDITGDVVGQEREKDLKNNYWKYMISKGSVVMRYRDDVDIDPIMDYLLSRKGTDLLIQEELSQGKSLKETGAGIVINKEMLELEKKYTEELMLAKTMMEEAIRDKDLETKAFLEEEAKKTADKIAKIQEDRETLERNMKNELETMRKQHEEEREKEREERREKELERERERHQTQDQNQDKNREDERLKEAQNAKERERFQEQIDRMLMNQDRHNKEQAELISKNKDLIAQFEEQKETVSSLKNRKIGFFEALGQLGDAIFK